jgi:hypothetical protein
MKDPADRVSRDFFAGLAARGFLYGLYAEG